MTCPSAGSEALNEPPAASFSTEESIAGKAVEQGVGCPFVGRFASTYSAIGDIRDRLDCGAELAPTPDHGCRTILPTTSSFSNSR
jgi:hypothetical protein